MRETVDAVIIGGGIHGASTAFHLSRRGLACLVVEQATLASQATGRSSGLVRMHYDLEPEARLAWESFRYFNNWSQMVGGSCEFIRTGFLQFVKPEFVAQLKANVAMQQRIGIPCLLITGKDVSRLAPSFVVDDIECAAYEPESGYADPTAATLSLMDAARRHAASIEQECRVTEVTVSSGAVTGVRTTAGDISTPLVINTAGAWAAGVAAMVGVELPIRTWRHDVLYVKRPVSMGFSHPSVIDDSNEMYFRPETGGLTLVGLEDGNPVGGSPNGFVDRAQPGFVEKAVDRICRRIPVMEQASLHSDHGGYDGITPDFRAVIGQMGPEGFYIQSGFSGTGFKLAPAVGACVAELILDGEAKTVDITPFRPQRFGEGKLLKGDHAYDNIWH